MKYVVSRSGTETETEALGAYSGYRIRLVAAREAGGATYAVRVWFRGSESLPETGLPATEPAFESLAAALDAGYTQAVEWIDRLNAIEAARWGDEPDPGTGHNG